VGTSGGVSHDPPFLHAFVISKLMMEARSIDVPEL
jgi:hypothetical protein